jgi:heptosyltransferase-2
LDTARPVAAFAPGAEYGPAKRWPARHFAQLARDLHARGESVWLFGSGKDAAVTAEINRLAGGSCVDLAGRTSLDEAIDLLSLAARVVSNDSGLMHVAAALDRPLAAIFGSSSPEFTPPLSARARVISLRLACSPCFARDCPLGHTNCLEKIEPADVLATLH